MSAARAFRHARSAEIDLVLDRDGEEWLIEPQLSYVRVDVLLISHGAIIASESYQRMSLDAFKNINDRFPRCIPEHQRKIRAGRDPAVTHDVTEDLLGRAHVCLPNGRPRGMHIHVIIIARRDIRKEIPLFTSSHGTAPLTNRVTDESGQQDTDLLGAVLQDKRHEPIDISVGEILPRLRYRRNMHDDIRLCSKLQGTDGPLKAPFLPSYSVMNLSPVIIQAQINQVQSCRSEPFHVSLIHNISVRFQRHDEPIEFPQLDDFEEVTTQGRLTTE